MSYTRLKNTQSKSILGSENVSKVSTKNFTRGIPPSEEEWPFMCTNWGLQHHIWLKLLQWFYREISSPDVFNMFLYACHFLALHRSGDENKFTTTTMADTCNDTFWSEKLTCAQRRRSATTHLNEEKKKFCFPRGFCLLWSLTIYVLFNIYSLLHDKGKFRNISN